MSRQALTDKELEIFVNCEFEADAPIEKLAKACRMKPHAVRYALNGMLERGVVRKTPILNLFALGYHEYYVWFNLSAKDSAAKKRALNFLKRSTSVWFLGEMNGEFQYWAAIFVRSHLEISKLFAAVIGACGPVIAEKQIVQSIRWWFYGRKFLSSSSPQNREIVLRQNVGEVHLDNTDHDILAILMREGCATAEISRVLGLPASTVSYRLKRLHQSGVISGWILSNLVTSTSLHRWELLINAGGTDPAFSKDLATFCRNHRHVSNLGEVLGEWDYEIMVEGFDSDVLRTFRAELEEFAAGRLVATRSCSVVRILKHCEYPSDLPTKSVSIRR